MAADAQPRAPSLALPPGACDCHAHICGPTTAFPYSAERIYTPPDATIDSYRHLLAVLGVDRAVLIQPSVYGTDNRAMLAALRAAGPGAFAAWRWSSLRLRRVTWRRCMRPAFGACG